MNSAAELREAVAEARRNGSASLTVPFFGANSHPFDDLLDSGEASSYELLVEISVTPEGGAS